MKDRPPERGVYWDAQARISELRLSARDVLLVSRVRRGGRWYVRLRVYRVAGQGYRGRPAPGAQGLIVPEAQAAALIEVLQAAVDRREPRA